MMKPSRQGDDAAILSVKWMAGYLHRLDLAIFGYRRDALALVVGAMLMTGGCKASLLEYKRLLSPENPPHP